MICNRCLYCYHNNSSNCLDCDCCIDYPNYFATVQIIPENKYLRFESS
jgi:hypothetical protein